MATFAYYAPQWVFEGINRNANCLVIPIEDPLIRPLNCPIRMYDVIELHEWRDSKLLFERTSWAATYSCDVAALSSLLARYQVQAVYTPHLLNISEVNENIAAACGFRPYFDHANQLTLKSLTGNPLPTAPLRSAAYSFKKHWYQVFPNINCGWEVWF